MSLSALRRARSEASWTTLGWMQRRRASMAQPPAPDAAESSKRGRCAAARREGPLHFRPAQQATGPPQRRERTDGCGASPPAGRRAPRRGKYVGRGLRPPIPPPSAAGCGCRAAPLARSSAPMLPAAALACRSAAGARRDATPRCRHGGESELLNEQQRSAAVTADFLSRSADTMWRALLCGSTKQLSARCAAWRNFVTSQQQNMSEV